MHRIFPSLVIVAFASTGLLVGQTASTVKRLPAKAASESKGLPASTAASSKAAATGKAQGKSKKKAPARRWVQSQPTPARYKEIQQALAAKGYFTGAVDGVWGNDSTDALKRFQQDQNLEADGKLGSLALIALGLGPKRDAPKPTAADPGAPR